ESKPPSHAKLIETLHPYMQLSSKCLCDKYQLMQRNVLIILAIMTKYYSSDCFLIDEITKFLAQILSQCEDNWSVLFALRCLENVISRSGMLQFKKTREAELLGSVAKLSQYI